MEFKNVFCTTKEDILKVMQAFKERYGSIAAAAEHFSSSRPHYSMALNNKSNIPASVLKSLRLKAVTVYVKEDE